MKKTRLAQALAFLSFLLPGVVTNTFAANIQRLPAGITPDNTGFMGLIGLVANLRAFDWSFAPIVGGTSVALTLTAAQIANNNVIDYSGSPAGGVTLTTATAAQIIAALPSSIPTDGFNFPLLIINDSSGQTVTLTAGTGVTVNGTPTIATAVCRLYLVAVNVAAATVNFTNCGSLSL